LNSLVHPVTLRNAESWLKEQRTAYAIKEAALIFESGSEKLLDYVITVTAPEQIRIERAVRRDHLSSAEVKERMDNQMNEENKKNLSDFVIINDERQALLPQVLRLHAQLLDLAKNANGNDSKL
jgi:dephospho-CoA kinase